MKTTWPTRAFTIREGAAPPFVIAVKGRVRWALECLVRAGGKGCTPIDTPGPRWAAYVHVLRGLGVNILTIEERHGGPFAGTHARYVLQSGVTPGGAAC